MSERNEEDGFAQVLRAEWTKLRTVRGWLIGLAVAAVLGTLLSIVSANGSNSGTCTGSNPAHMVCIAGHPAVPVGPGGQIVARHLRARKKVSCRRWRDHGAGKDAHRIHR